MGGSPPPPPEGSKSLGAAHCLLVAHFMLRVRRRSISVRRRPAPIPGCALEEFAVGTPLSSLLGCPFSDALSGPQ
eukprot:2607826-Alexandrium_andersonii.AAC.1